jgi:lipopolysaccharide/colanic/teichoic acid biosynthesis glycosyltransferase
MYKQIIKPFGDVMIAIILIIILFPAFLLLSFLLFFFQGENPFFTQARPCKKEGIFKFFKFRTMKNTKDTDGILLPDNYRITKIGKFVRSASFDELTQLFNVVLE